MLFGNNVAVPRHDTAFTYPEAAKGDDLRF